MKQSKITLFVLLLLFFGFGLGKAQTTYTVNHNLTIISNNNCGTSNVITYNDQSVQDNIVTVKVEVNHNLPLGSGTSTNILNTHGWRHIDFKIYKRVGGLRILETTIQTVDKWLRGATSVASGGSSTQYANLTLLDLQNANISEGEKEVEVEVKYDFTGNNTPNTIDLVVSHNGVATCSKPNFAVGGNKLFCNFPGTANCFNYYHCNAQLLVLGYIMVNPKLGLIYNLNANIHGGSGNYSFEWIRSFASPVGVNAQVAFQAPSKGGTINLTVTDNVTGCKYYWGSMVSNKMDDSFPVYGSPFDLQIGPNPTSANVPLHVTYFLPEADGVDVDLFDLSGRKVRSLARELTGTSGVNTLEITPRDLRPGIYFLRLNTAQNGHLMKKLIITD